MKKLLMLLSAMFICTVALADTINLHWLNYDGTNYQNSTCTVDADLILPSTPPTRYGYTFTGWKVADYIPIEYLESTGTQYIDTGFMPTNNTSVEFEYAFSVAPSSDKVIFGSRTNNDWNNSDDQFYVACKNFSTGLYLYSGETKFTIQSIIVLNTFYKHTVDNSVATENGTRPMYLYAFNNKGDLSGLSQIKIKYLKIYDNNMLIRDFIPVLDEDGTPCMYDRVEGKFYYNQGTGDFIAGPVVSE